MRILTRRNFLKFSSIVMQGLWIAPSAFARSLKNSLTKDSATSYPIDPQIATTLERTIQPGAAAGLLPKEMSQVSKYGQYGYGHWSYGPPLAMEVRNDLMRARYLRSAYQMPKRLMQFFTITDIHITDKESPSQLIYLQQIDSIGEKVTSIYSPIMPYTTHVLDAAVQTINMIHERDPIDFGISLGDTCNSTQYNELRWYIDVLDGKVITPSSGAHLGADTIDYQKPYKAAGLNPQIPWYQVMGNHDHFWLGSFPVTDYLRKSYTGDTVVALGNPFHDPANFLHPDYYMGVLDGSTKYAEIVKTGEVNNSPSAPRIVADPLRRSLLRSEWMKEFFNSTTRPKGHGFDRANAEKGFACYSFLPKPAIPLKVIVLDDTQSEEDGSLDIHGHGFLDRQRYEWLKRELKNGQDADQLMIVAAHIPIGVEPGRSELGWWSDPQNAVTLKNLVAELHNHPNLLLWVAGHRHYNTVKAFPSPDPAGAPENGFWQVETSSLRDFPQQFRLFEIMLNDDYTVSMKTRNVDPSVRAGTPAATSRAYAVAAQQIVKTPGIYQAPIAFPDPSIRRMPTGSYNAELRKTLSRKMVEALQSQFYWDR